jgi:hypothetical protein
MQRTCRIPPGTYRLTRDVVNPLPDLRQRYDWRARPVWPAGTEVVVSKETYAIEGECGGHFEWSVLRLAGGASSQHRIAQHSIEHADQFEAIAGALLGAEESVAALFTRLDIDRQPLFLWLVEHGEVDRADVERIWAAYMEDESAP